MRLLDFELIDVLTAPRYLLSDIRRLQDKLQPSKTDEGDRECREARYKSHC